MATAHESREIKSKEKATKSKRYCRALGLHKFCVFQHKFFTFQHIYSYMHAQIFSSMPCFLGDIGKILGGDSTCPCQACQLLASVPTKIHIILTDKNRDTVHS
jgi:hypothetical protein